jgi:hypothetical protein
MATPGREYSLDHHLLEHLRYSGIERENLADLISIVVSLKHKYGIAPLTATAQGYPEPNAIRVSYSMDSLALNKIINILLDIPRLSAINVAPLGIPRSAQFAVEITLGGA